MRVCNKCKKRISVASIRKIQFVGGNGEFATPEEENLMSEIELCPGCVKKIANEIKAGLTQ